VAGRKCSWQECGRWFGKVDESHVSYISQDVCRAGESQENTTRRDHSSAMASRRCELARCEGYRCSDHNEEMRNYGLQYIRLLSTSLSYRCVLAAKAHKCVHYVLLATCGPTDWCLVVQTYALLECSYVYRNTFAVIATFKMRSTVNLCTWTNGAMRKAIVRSFGIFQTFLSLKQAKFLFVCAHSALFGVARSSLQHLQIKPWAQQASRA